MKQTAVEWLFKQISTSKHFYNLMEDINSRSTVAQSNIFDQAKAMEKEQIVDAHIEGQRVFDNYNHTQWTTDQAEHYYSEIFNK